MADARPSVGPESARAAILSRIRDALADQPAPTEVARTYRRDAERGTDVVALFAERAADYRATVEIVDEPDLAAAIAAALHAHGARRVAVPADLPEHWLDGAQDSDGPDIAWLRDDPPLSVVELDGTDGVVTAAALAIALTGTVVLDAGRGSGSTRAYPAARSARVCRAVGSDRRDGAAGDRPARRGAGRRRGSVARRRRATSS